MRKTLLLALLATAAAPGFAQKMAPGLWEMKLERQGMGAEMQAAMAQAREQMARMPPEQRKRMEEMMAKQGVSMSGGDPGAMRICITKEQAERTEIPQQNKSCRQEIVQRSAAGVKFNVVCTEPPSRSTGEYAFDGDKAFKGSFKSEHTRQGKVETFEMQQSGRWLGADCGALARK